MSKKQKPATDETPAAEAGGHVNLAAVLSKKKDEKTFNIWLVGDTPLITHAWSEKAKREMLSKQVKATKPGKEARDPEQDFVNSLYDMGDGSYGFPAMGVKNCIVSAAHKDKGIARAAVEKAIWLDAQMVRTRPALAGAICDMPLLRIYGDSPVMREDMVKVGSGLNKTATLAYRAQFTVWALRVTGKFNASVLSAEAFAFLIAEAGATSGIGEWRNERKGMFGAFHLADVEEQEAWDRYAAEQGPLPVPSNYRMAAE